LSLEGRVRFMGSGVELYLPDAGGRPAALTPGFVREVEAQAGRRVSRCYQCKKCTSGCPVSSVLDYQCHEIVRLVQLGAKDETLRSQAIWLCASCKTCRERCPNDVDPAQVMDTLKILAVASGTPIGRKRVKAFQKAFLTTVAALGRAHELGSIALYVAGNPSSLPANMGLGLKMFSRGKMKIIPEGVKAKDEIRAIFRRARERAPKGGAGK
jgi:heterodisulfide reductase subunit C